MGSVRLWHHDPVTLIAAADGSALGNPGPAGWAWYIDPDHWASGGWPHGTNNMGELTAVLDLLRQTAGLDDDLLIYCDSQYVINSLTKWLPGWKRKNWRKGDGKPVLNVEIMKALDEALQGRRVRFEWVKGHSGHPLNEEADRLANGAAVAFSQGRTPPNGPGFTTDAAPAERVSADAPGSGPVGQVSADAPASGPVGRVSAAAPDSGPVGRVSAAAPGVDLSADDELAPATYPHLGFEIGGDGDFEPGAYPDASIELEPGHHDESIELEPGAYPDGSIELEPGANRGTLDAPTPGTGQARTKRSPAKDRAPTSTLNDGYSDDLFSLGEAQPSDIEHVVALERSLLSDAVRADPAAVAALLHPDWYEIGRSGRLWSRPDQLAVIGVLPEPVTLEVVLVDRLGPETILLLWRSQGADGSTLRTSLWVRSGGDWVQRFHQGTPESQL